MSCPGHPAHGRPGGFPGQKNGSLLVVSSSAREDNYGMTPSVVMTEKVNFRHYPAAHRLWKFLGNDFLALLPKVMLKASSADEDLDVRMRLVSLQGKDSCGATLRKESRNSYGVILISLQR